MVDPTQLNRQGEDVGTQYRNGVFYVEEEDQPIVAEMVEHLQKMHQETVVTEVRELENFYPAEEYHQHYLEKNPTGYCHINLFDAEEFIRENGLEK